MRISWCGLLVAAGLAVRVAALPLPGTEDVNVWKIWSYNAAQDVTAVYGIGGSPPERRLLQYHRMATPVDYPPVALYELAVVGRVYRVFDSDFSDDWHLLAALKIPGLLAGMTLTWLLYRTTRRLTGSVQAAQIAALSYFLNPAILLNGEVLGYLDPLMMLPALAAFMLIDVGGAATPWAGACLAIAILTKPQAVLIAPAFALAAWRRLDLRRRLLVALTGTVTVALIVLPYAIVGALANMWLAFGSFYARRDILSGAAANVWWIANYRAPSARSVTSLARLSTRRCCEIAGRLIGKSRAISTTGSGPSFTSRVRIARRVASPSASSWTEW